MTIIEPNKNKLRAQIRASTTPLLVLIVLGAVLTIAFYNESVELRYRLSTQEKKLETLKVANAELRNQLYTIINANTVSRIANELGLILEKKPIYLESSTEVLAKNL